MKIIVGGENIIEKDSLVDPIENRWKFPYCLPTNSGGKYFASHDGVDFIPVDEKFLWEYPYVKINKYRETKYSGVSIQGISLLAFEIDHITSNAFELELGVYPSFICLFNDKLQIIFRLKDYIPRIAKQPTWFYLDYTIGKICGHLNGELEDVLINPYCNKIKSYIFNTDGMSLEEINNTLPDIKKAEHRENARKARSKSGARSAKIRSDKSIDIILKIVLNLNKEGKIYTQKMVSEICGKSRKTVNKHWPAIMKRIEGK